MDLGLLFIYCFNILFASGAYFSMSDMQLNIPGNQSRYPARNVALITLNALPSDRSDKDTAHFRYSIVSEEKYLQVYPNTGDIMFTDLFLNRTNTDIKNITVGASVEDSSGRKDNTTFHVNIYPPSVLDCGLLVSDLCYWQSAKYRIFENRPASVIGALSSSYLLEMCTGFKMKYTIGNKKETRVELVPATDINKSWSLRTRKYLERDVLRSVNPFAKNISKQGAGEFINVSVKCYVEDAHGIKQEVSKRITVQVLDENDNAPVLQDNGDVLVELYDSLVKKGEQVEFRQGSDKKHKLIFIDRDSPAVNHHETKLLNDSLGIFNLECSTHEDDRDKEAQTITHCGLIFAKSMKTPSTPYTVLLQINDTTLLPGFGESFLHIPIHLHSSNDIGYPQALTIPPHEFRGPLILYPYREITIFRTAGPLARVTQPKEPIKHVHQFTLLNNTDHVRVFNITANDGIIYVHDIKLLRECPTNVRLNIQWQRDGIMEMDELIIKIIAEPSNTCANITNNIHNWSHCAKYNNKEKCLKACALATGGSVSVDNRIQGGPKRCMWRGDDKPGNETTHIYSTCTPDTSKCPDSICDSLEKLHYLICPQDCSDKVQFPTQKNRKTGRGIETALGVCTCDQTGNCLCNQNLKKRYNKSNNETKNAVVSVENVTTAATGNLSRRTGIETANCGTTCILGIIAGGLFLLSAIAVVVVCWRFGRVHKVRGKFTDENNDLSAPLSDYVDRGIMPDNTITLNFDMTTSLTQHPHHKMNPDPKWEFPRNQLIIEQTLGEGEFGRVLRARAMDIAGQPGYSIVAVKTLKEDAREAELSDLLSEYELLKEVSHPNVIRLLGASTLPGGPVYLIIEFAQYGSLRSYLRRSRHLKSESFAPLSARFEETHNNYDKPKNCNVNPKDLLTFAWQICNGMTYLSDVKLVHRDLAARNVLLSSEKICKISDFGLTRDVYEDDAYYKRSKGRVPVKWMAPESLADHVYTCKSDVWSFGILVWELVTLGATPYPGIQVQNLFHLLKSGYRMERPDNCSTPLYVIMKSCWHIDPEQRPSFQKLTLMWEQMLGDQVEYLDLTPNAIHNRSYFCSLEENEGEDLNEIQELEVTTTDKVNSNDDENLERNREYSKCGNSEKLLSEPQPENDTTSNSNRVSPGIVSMQGYETPVKIRFKEDRSKTPTENPQYYTNMDSSRNNN